MIQITCTKCNAVIATYDKGKKIKVDTNHARILERDASGNIYCICNCGHKKIIRAGWWWDSPTIANRRSGRRVA